MGMGFAITSIGLLVGAPISGAILNTSGSFVYVWLFGGLLVIIGTCSVIGTRVLKGGVNLLEKV